MIQLLQSLIRPETANITLESLDNESEEILEQFTHLPEPLINILQPLDDSDLEEIAGISAHVIENKTTIKCTESMSLQSLVRNLQFIKIICRRNLAQLNYGSIILVILMS